MPNNKIPPRQELRIGLIALMLVVVAMAIAAPVVQAAANAKTPTCKIISPKTGAVFSANKEVSFAAQATLKDASAKPLRYEWDFSGGVFGELIRTRDGVCTPSQRFTVAKYYRRCFWHR